MKKMFYRMEEIAPLLLTSRRTLYNHIYQNRVNGTHYPVPPYIKLNGRILFPVDEFEDWISSQPRVASNQTSGHRE